MENQEKTQGAQEQKKASKKLSIIESLFSRSENKLEKMFSPREIISAKTAYMKTKYGRELTQTDLLHDFMLKTRHMIDVRISEGHYMGTIEVYDDVMEFLPQLKKYYEDNGYDVVILSPKTKIYNEDENGAEKQVSVRINSTMLLLLWGGANISEVISGHGEAADAQTKNGGNDETGAGK